MKILVTGATGLIGASLCARLEAEGHEVRRVLRRSRPAGSSKSSDVILDMTEAVRPEDWSSPLSGVDAVVNCAGVLQDNAREKVQEVHAIAASALFRACERAGIKTVIHFSAIGVDRDQPSAFSASKLAGDKALMALDVGWVILRPSVVLGRGVFGASALLRGLAALPLLLAMPNTGRLQVVQLDDIVSTVLFFLQPASPTRLTLELAGPEALTMTELISRYRQWFGWKKATVFTVPGWAARGLYRLGDLAGWLGWRPPIRSNAQKEITRGAVGDPQPWIATTGIHPASLASALAADPATVQERWFAGLYFIKPAIFVVLPFFWIMTGIISLTTGWRNGVELLIGTAVAPHAEAAVVAGAIADAAVGALIAFRPTSRPGLWGAIAISLFYAIAGTILRPDLWNEPLGPLMKILPILALHFVALAILEER
ncbi:MULTISPECIES: SDR family oxidoreductase [unclassified Mesorhizobium]|uniref:SDR family oxidoreductase n=1 Tax=unclassified Mesorhizobium TaxID=325217 RepID=UPI00112B9C11|nr:MULTISPECIES: SDR family oxidoreductase [unclassified Mesorhizobium]MBZ9898264.1 SDR family oxidoreductase [Mesorhizobium sp. BR1-1-6]TPL21138.1 SDR family oxidoreductase [Mesorhizobium sp. B2-4-9]TPN30263.1 SDR family oxidoreductase [Mesorhizobium sp. B1-1-6]